MGDEMAPCHKALVVDDEEHVRAILVRFLQSAGIEAAEAATGGRALELVRRQSFSVILTDLGLPDMSGVQIIRELRQICPRARIVVLSGDVHGLDPDEAAELRVDAVLAKPVGIRQFLDEVRRLITAGPWSAGGL